MDINKTFLSRISLFIVSMHVSPCPKSYGPFAWPALSDYAARYDPIAATARFPPPDTITTIGPKHHIPESLSTTSHRRPNNQDHADPLGYIQIQPSVVPPVLFSRIIFYALSLRHSSSFTHRCA